MLISCVYVYDVHASFSTFLWDIEKEIRKRKKKKKKDSKKCIRKSSSCCTKCE